MSRRHRSLRIAALVAGLAGAFVLALPPHLAMADGIAPGEWKLTQAIIMNGGRAPPQTQSRCLTAEQAGDTATTFSPQYKTVNSDCERTEFSSSATALHWRMTCTGDVDMEVTGDFVFDTPTHYTATIVSKGAMRGRDFVNTTVAIEGEHMGECK